MSEENKVDEDFGDALADLLSKYSKEMEENPIKIEDDFEYPMEISGIEKGKGIQFSGTKSGSLVKIRPCGEEYKNKTYLGIYMGDITVDTHVGLYTNTNILSIIHSTNPAIFVLELKKIIFGYESWWEEIKSEEELQEITDEDINSVWYVQLLKEMSKDGLAERAEDNKTSE